MDVEENLLGNISDLFFQISLERLGFICGTYIRKLRECVKSDFETDCVFNIPLYNRKLCMKLSRYYKTENSPANVE